MYFFIFLNLSRSVPEIAGNRTRGKKKKKRTQNRFMESMLVTNNSKTMHCNVSRSMNLSLAKKSGEINLAEEKEEKRGRNIERYLLQYIQTVVY